MRRSGSSSEYDPLLPNDMVRLRHDHRPLRTAAIVGTTMTIIKNNTRAMAMAVEYGLPGFATIV